MFMKNKWVVWVGIAFSFASMPLFSQNESLSLKKVNQVDFSHISIKDNFWSPRLEKHLSATLPVCIDQIENKTGRIQNFERAAKGRGEHSGIFFDDSDVYKAMEGMAYALANARDAKLEAKLDEWIDKIAACQQPDGYINTFYTLTGLQNRWTDMDKHEMYCAGHMIEAGVAYYQATGKRKLMDVGIRMAEHCMSLFDVGKGHWVPGHEEIELALVKLYLATGEKRFLNFAHHLLEQRGHGYGSTGKPLMERPLAPMPGWAGLAPVDICESADGQYYYLLCFLGPWITDSFAYFTGVFFGRHKLIPEISPKKTVEGSLGGIIFCIISTNLKPKVCIKCQ